MRHAKICAQVRRYYKHRSYFLHASQENLCSGSALQSMQEEAAALVITVSQCCTEKYAVMYGHFVARLLH